MPSIGLLQKIVTAYPQLRSEWLLSGTGPMIKTGEPSDRSPIDDMFDDMVRPRAQDKIAPPANDEVTERPTPEIGWKADLMRRLDIIKREEVVLVNNSQRLHELIREAYEIITPDIISRSTSDDMMPHWFTMELTRVWNYPFKPNANAAWGIIRSNYIGLCPQFPFLHYFLDFADPHRRIAVFVEEQEDIWQPEDVDYQDKILITHGWKVFRIPHNVARIYESDVLPAHLKDAYSLMIEGRASAEVIEERRNWHDHLGKTTIDGFFRWLKLDYFLDDIDF